MSTLAEVKAFQQRERDKRKALRVACPICLSAVKDHPQNGCVLAALMGVVAERGNLSQRRVNALHAKVDTNKLWDDLGPILDHLEWGRYSE